MTRIKLAELLASPDENANCEWCGKPFIKQHFLPQHRFCSSKCCMKHYQSLPEVRKDIRNYYKIYNKLPRVKKKLRKYREKYIKKPGVLEKIRRQKRKRYWERKAEGGMRK